MSEDPFSFEKEFSLVPGSFESSLTFNGFNDPLLEVLELLPWTFTFFLNYLLLYSLYLSLIYTIC